MPLAKVTYPEKNLIYFWKMKKEERANEEKKKQEKMQVEDINSQLKKVEEILVKMEKNKPAICTVAIQQELDTNRKIPTDQM